MATNNSKLIGIALGTSVTYLLMVACRRFHSWYQLENCTADPQTPEEAYPIYNNLGFVDFPFFASKALEFGFFKTYSIPSISSILQATKQLTEDTLKRYDDTDLIVREFLEHSPSSIRSELAIRRLNFIHGKYVISNEDYLYVLCVFVVEPVRWVNEFGYRKVHRREAMSAYIIWKDVGEKMGLHSIPPSFAAMEAFMEEYEGRKMRFSPANKRIADATAEMMMLDLPRPLRPAGHLVVHAMCDMKLRDAMGFPHPPALLSMACRAALRVTGLFTRFFLLPRFHPMHRTPDDAAALLSSSSSSPPSPQTGLGVLRCPMFNHYGSRVYLDGYRIETLGPRSMQREPAETGLGKLFAPLRPNGATATKAPP